VNTPGQLRLGYWGKANEVPTGNGRAGAEARWQSILFSGTGLRFCFSLFLDRNVIIGKNTALVTLDYFAQLVFRIHTLLDNFH
jgi:hypothetical protein